MPSKQRRDMRPSMEKVFRALKVAIASHEVDEPDLANIMRHAWLYPGIPDLEQDVVAMNFPRPKGGGKRKTRIYMFDWVEANTEESISQCLTEHVREDIAAGLLPRSPEGFDPR